MAGTIIADTWQNGDGTQNYKCRAWVNFNGTGTVVIRGSGNVSSITDNGVGDYTVNFTTAMPDANYSVVTMGSEVSGQIGAALKSRLAGTRTSSAIQLFHAGTTSVDGDYLCVSIFK